MPRIAFGVLVAALLTACVPVTSPPDPGIDPVPDPALDACGAGELQGLVGQPASVLTTMKFRLDTRILRPGMAVTMDFRPDRLNIDIDAGEKITRVYCT